MAKAKKNVSAGLSPTLHDRMMDLVTDSDTHYSYKAEFVRDAIRERVERLESEQAEVPPPGVEMDFNHESEHDQ